MALLRFSKKDIGNVESITEFKKNFKNENLIDLIAFISTNELEIFFDKKNKSISREIMELKSNNQSNETILKKIAELLDINDFEYIGINDIKFEINLKLSFENKNNKI